MSLRRGLSLFVITLATLAMVAGISLVVLTTHLHRTTRDMEHGLHSVKIAEELQIDLLTYLRTQDASERARIELNLREGFRDAESYVNTPEEAAALERSEER